jgi:hypothetical protein
MVAAVFLLPGRMTKDHPDEVVLEQRD